MVFASYTAPFKISAPYVRGAMYERGRRNTGSCEMGKNSPQRNIMGKRKKLEKVWASNTSLTATAIRRPRKVEAIAIRITAGRKAAQATWDRSTRNRARMTGTNALA